MMKNKVNRLVCYLFGHRKILIVGFALLTLFLGWQASELPIDAGFTKNIPVNHEYMQTYLKHRQNFGGANTIMVAVEDKQTNIFNAEFFDLLREVHDQLFFIPGIDRSLVKSLYSPSTRFTEVVENGFVGGPVIPAKFSNTPAELEVIRNNIETAGLTGRLVAEDYSAALLTVQLLNFDPQTGKPIDTLAFADQLEQKLRQQFESDRYGIHIIGFAKMVGDVADGAQSVFFFFLIAIVITSLLVYLFSRSWLLTFLSLICCCTSVIWQLGLLNLVGFGLDPMSILVPFLIFAIAMSHGVQIINAVRKRVLLGLTPLVASINTFRVLLIPGGIALLSDTVGFFTLLIIDIGVIRELAISASLGVASVILTNLVLLPLLLSLCSLRFKQCAVSKLQIKLSVLWQYLAKCATLKFAIPITVLTLFAYGYGLYQAEHLKIGDLHDGAPALHKNSRYNQDVQYINQHFSITTDILSVIVESFPEACTYHSALEKIDEFEWLMANVTGVESTSSLAKAAKQINSGYNEANAKWQVLPRNQASLAQAVGRIPSSSGYLNTDCSVMPIYIFLKDHHAETIARVIDKAKFYQSQFDDEKVKFQLASGPIGVMAATNEAVEAAQLPMLIYVFLAVAILCFISFRSIKATLAVIIPLYVVSVLAQGLMTKLQIGLTVNTLPVIALGIGIGVDYGIYILSSMMKHLRAGKAVMQAYLAALYERGGAVIFTGITLTIGVSTWYFSALKFQMDMGILLTFMFLMNMVGAVVVLPALCAIFWPKR